ATKANLRVTLGDDWFYKDGKLQQIRDHMADAETERNSRMSEATARINWLEDAQKDGDISADEEKELTELRAYRTALRRLDLSTAPKINWPDAPA
ncbi:TPA: tail fiber assembly protein, partial [Citrobacter freundii]|nr:tail fiber assembly protein [Citrobacter freundii]